MSKLARFTILSIHSIDCRSFLSGGAVFNLNKVCLRFPWNTAHLNLPKPGEKNLRRKVFYPEKYTIRPLDNHHLAGRDELTGRVIQKTLGGGLKHKYHWIDWYRVGPKENVPPLEERVIQIMKCGCRTAHIALVGHGPRLKYILATLNMKPGDIIHSSQYIPVNPVFPNEGDAYPLGALPDGTKVHCIERLPGQGGFYVHAAGTCGTILRKVQGRVIVQLPSKLEVSLMKECMATVGQLSNAQHENEQLGSANKLRETGRRPRSGLWHRKDSRYGRRIKPPPPVRVINPDTSTKPKKVRFTHPTLRIEIFDRDLN